MSGYSTHVQDQVKLQDVQAQVFDRVLAQLAEHFEHFAIVVTPGGGGEVLAPPRWGWSGNRLILTGAIEMAKADMIHSKGNRSGGRA